MPSPIDIHLAALTAALIDACGGYISAALECDVSKSQLARAADAHNPYSLKATTIWHLEQSCGQPIMSRALLALSQQSPNNDKCPIHLGVDFADSATDLTVAIVAALDDGEISIFEHRELTGSTSGMHSRLTELSGSLIVNQASNLSGAM